MAKLSAEAKARRREKMMAKGTWARPPTEKQLAAREAFRARAAASKGKPGPRRFIGPLLASGKRKYGRRTRKMGPRFIGPLMEHQYRREKKKRGPAPPPTARQLAAREAFAAAARAARAAGHKYVPTGTRLILHHPSSLGRRAGEGERPRAKRMRYEAGVDDDG